MDSITKSRWSRAAAREARPRVAEFESMNRATGTRTGFWARIGTATAAGTNRYTYAFLEVAKTTAGYGGWTTLTGGRTGTAYNANEDGNSGSGTLGNGVLVSHLNTSDWTFTVSPFPSGVVMWIDEVDCNGTTEYWFNMANGVDGTCD